MAGTKVRIFAIFFLAGSAVAAQLSAAEQPAQLNLRRVALLASPEVEQSGLADLIFARLAKGDNDSLELVERLQLRQVAKEIELSALFGSGAGSRRVQAGQMLRADALVLLKFEKLNGQQILRLVISDCHYGVRLRTRLFVVEEKKHDAAATICATEIQAQRKRFPRGIEKLLAVAPLVSRNLTHEYDHLQDAYAQLIHSALTIHPGVAVLELEEAEAIRREQQQTGRQPTSEMPLVPLIVSGSFRMERPNPSGPVEVDLAVQVADSKRAVERWENRHLAKEAVTAALTDQIPRTILRHSDGAARSDNRAQSEALNQEAQSLALLGDWRRASHLREAALLLAPDNAAARWSLLADYRRDMPLRWKEQLDAVAQRAQGGSWKQIVAAEADACRQAQAEMFERWRRELEHLRWLIEHEKLNPREAALLLAGLRHDLGRVQFPDAARRTPAEIVSLLRGVAWDIAQKKNWDYSIQAGGVRPEVQAVSPYRWTRGDDSGQHWNEPRQYDALMLELGRCLVLTDQPTTERDVESFSASAGPGMGVANDPWARLPLEIGLDADSRTWLLKLLGEATRADMPPISFAAYALGSYDLRRCDVREMQQWLDALHQQGDTARVYHTFARLIFESRRAAQRDTDGRNESNEPYASQAAALARQLKLPEPTSIVETSRNPYLWSLCTLQPDVMRKIYARDATQRGPVAALPAVPPRLPAGQAIASLPTRIRLSSDVSQGSAMTRMFACGDRGDLVTDAFHTSLVFQQVDGACVTLPPAARDVGQFLDRAWDGRSLWIATEKEGVHIYSPDGALLTKVGAAEGLPPYDYSRTLKLLSSKESGLRWARQSYYLRLWPVSAGRCLAVGILGEHRRVWFALIEQQGANASVRVFHEATNTPAPGELAAADPHGIFQPDWFTELETSGARPRRLLLVGRASPLPGGMPASVGADFKLGLQRERRVEHQLASRPLAIDLETLEVFLLPIEIQSPRDRRMQSNWAQCIAAAGGKLFLLNANGLTACWPQNGDPRGLWEQQTLPLPSGALIRHGDYLLSPQLGLTWYAIDPASLAIQPVAVDAPWAGDRNGESPRFGQIVRSAHYGLVANVWFEKQLELIPYRLTTDLDPDKRVRGWKPLPPSHKLRQLDFPRNDSPIAAYRPLAAPIGHGNNREIEDIVLLPDRRRMVTCAKEVFWSGAKAPRQPRSEVWLWDLGNRRHRVLVQDTDRLTQLSLDPDGKTLHAYGPTQRLRWNLDHLDEPPQVEKDTANSAWRCTQSADFQYQLEWTSAEGTQVPQTPLLRDLKNQRQTFLPERFTTNALFTSDGSRLFTESAGGVYEVWDTSGRRLDSLWLKQFPEEHLLSGATQRGACLSPDGKILYFSTLDASRRWSRVFAWNLAEKQHALALTWEGQHSYLAATPDGRHLICYGPDSGGARLFDIQSQKCLVRWARGFASQPQDIQFVTQGRCVIANTGAAVEFWDLADVSQVRQLTAREWLNIEHGNANAAPYLPLVPLAERRPQRVAPPPRVPPPDTLHAAAGRGDVAAVHAMLGRGAAVDSLGALKTTSLHVAAAAGHENVVRLLLDKKANINARRKWHETALFEALENDQEEIARLLLERGANAKYGSKVAITPLHLVAVRGSAELARRLIAARAPLEARGPYGRTPLHEAAYYGNIEVLKVLLESGAVIEARAEHDFTPLHFAAEQGHHRAVSTLLAHGADRKARVNKSYATAPDRGGKMAIDLAGNEATRLLLQDRATSRPDKASSSIHDAARDGNLPAVDEALRSGTALTVRDALGRTLLQAAAAGGQLLLVQWLIDRECDVRATDEGGRTALHWAAFSGHVDVAQRLVAQGADVNAKTSRGRTPLFFALGDINVVDPKGEEVGLHTYPVAMMPGASRRRLPIVKFLLQQGAKVNVVDDAGLTPVLYAARNGQLSEIRALAAKEADFKALTPQGESALLLAAGRDRVNLAAYLLAGGCDVNQADQQGRTPLLAALPTFREEYPMVASLLSHGAKVNVRNQDGATPLQLALHPHPQRMDMLYAAGAEINTARNDGATALHLASDPKVAEWLLARGADLEARDKGGRTPLHKAADQFGAVVPALLAQGADVNSRTTDGTTALHLAVARGVIEVVEALLDAGAEVDAQDNAGRRPIVLARDSAMKDTLIAYGAVVERIQPKPSRKSAR